MDIYTLDLRRMTDGDQSERTAFAAEIGKAFKGLGFAAIVGHGFSLKDRETLYQSVKGIFALSTEEKMACHVEGGMGQRGYTPFGVEHAKGETAPDQKEFFQWGPMDADVRGLDQNVAVNPGTDATIKEVYEKLERIGYVLMEAIAMDLDLDVNFFDTYLEKGHSIFRAIHYPPQPEAPEEGIRAGAHEDINLITLLMGASTEGLEVVTAEGNWLPFHVTDDTLVINVGDMLQRLSNGIFKSTTHRVVNPVGDKRYEPRFSLPFFLHPVEDMSLNCLPNCISDDRPKGFEDITAGDYLTKRLKEIGLM